jgi:L,D-transpeptidase ErfK/SrfK
MSTMMSRRAFTAGAVGAAGGALVAAPAAAGRTGDLLGEVTYHVTRPGETLLDLARAHNLGVPEISAANPAIDPWVPDPETLLTLPTGFLLPDAPREGIVVNYGELRLFHFPKAGPPRTFAIGIGREGFELMLGRTRVVRKQERPTWYPTADTRRDRPEVGTVVPPGPDNPLGDFALYLGWPAYLIHGTNKPYGVGRRVSRGCIRMYPEGVEQLFASVPPGTPVTAVDQPVKVGWHQGELHLEVQPDMAQIDELEASQVMSERPPEDRVRRRLLDRAGAEASRIDWAVVEAELRARRGLPVQVTRGGGPAAAITPRSTPAVATGPSGLAPPTTAIGKPGLSGLY